MLYSFSATAKNYKGDAISFIFSVTFEIGCETDRPTDRHDDRNMRFSQCKCASLKILSELDM